MNNISYGNIKSIRNIKGEKNKKKVILKNGVELVGAEKYLSGDPKALFYIDNQIKEWALYSTKNNENVFDLYKKDKTLDCHFGLELDKFTNFFNFVSIFNSKNSKTIEVPSIVIKNTEFFLDNIKSNYCDIDVITALIDKLVIGLGSHSVYETSIKIHHTYNVPYIPASAIKGCLRSHIILKYFDGDEIIAEKSKWFVCLFGGEYDGKKYKGNIQFLDAFPVRRVDVEKDVMTPHDTSLTYKDLISPNPITFLTVKNTKFRFILRINKDYSCIFSSCKEYLTEKFIAKEFNNMLVFHGIGAKTSVGYGFFDGFDVDKTIRKSTRRKNELVLKIQKEEKEKLLEGKSDSYKIYFNTVLSKETENEKFDSAKKLLGEKDKFNLDKGEIKALAEIILSGLKSRGKFKYIKGKEGKNKDVKNTKMVCEILNLDLPV